METTVKERLTMFLAYKKISQGRFEKMCGLSNGFVNNIRKSISVEKLQLITLNYPELNKGWVLAGEGEMLKEYKLPVNEVQMVNDPSYSEMEVIRSQSRTIEAQTRIIEDQATQIKVMTERIAEKNKRVVELTDMLLSKPTQKGFIQDTEKVG